MVIQELAAVNALNKLGDLREALHGAKMALAKEEDPAMRDKLALGCQLVTESIEKQLKLFNELAELVGMPWELIGLDDREKVRKAAQV